MADIVSVCVASPPAFNFELFKLWVEGKSVTESRQFLLSRSRNQTDKDKNNSSATDLDTENLFGELVFERPNTAVDSKFPELLTYEFVDRYRLFQILEHFLQDPLILRSQSLCIIPRDIHALVLEYYWSLDDSFAREVLNKRLTKGR